MIAKMIDGVTRVLGKEQGYLGLPIRDEPIKDPVTGCTANCMISSWEPTPEELVLLNAGGHVRIRLLGKNHPPIGVTVK